MSYKPTVEPKLKNPYPSIGFGDAYAHLLKVYKELGSVLFDRKALLTKGLGFPEKSGAGHNVVGSLSHYGLLTKIVIGKSVQYKLTDLAIQLASTEYDSPEWREVALQSATAPQLHRDLYMRFTSGALPPDVGNLLMQRYDKVNEKNVQKIIDIYKKSLISAGITEATTPPVDQALPPNPTRDNPAKVSTSQSFIDIDLGDGVIAHLPKKALLELYEQELNRIREKLSS